MSRAQLIVENGALARAIADGRRQASTVTDSSWSGSIERQGRRPLEGREEPVSITRDEELGDVGAGRIFGSRGSTRTCRSWGGRTRTSNFPVNSRAVCQLTYTPMHRHPTPHREQPTESRRTDAQRLTDVRQEVIKSPRICSVPGARSTDRLRRYAARAPRLGFPLRFAHKPANICIGLTQYHWTLHRARGERTGCTWLPRLQPPRRPTCPPSWS